MDRRLRADLLRRAARDQRARASTPRTFLSPLTALRFVCVDGGNTAWLDRVVRRREWPGFALVGTDGAHAAWLLAQHADWRRQAQRRFLRAMRQAVERGDADPKDLAYLEDRVRVNAGRPQLYGTQYGMTASGFGPQPIEDPDGLDDRRAEVGLPPMAEYEAQMRRRLAERPGGPGTSPEAGSL
ncbi:DUF6624 domain-containing protein [Actinomadura verrucosospora]|uniref:Uncharacterized protein n=1 Tax=Actinomadura verrucosospora TaxID=46165 RepID=A0A7D3VU99_ACTVE|nr:DUF6624 domain-containing protein [Actinomadura verrucosospora]QKG23475.1 hypothetical protein ACTIVE_5118 [Actinomadura verrucosospora]